MSNAPLTFGQMLSAQARLQPDKLAARDFERAMTYRQWDTRANRLANALVDLGLAKGDRVAVLGYNRAEWAEIYAAAAKAGLVVVPINFRLTGPEVQYILEDSSACALVVEEALVPVVESVRDALTQPASRFIEMGSERPQAGYRAYEDLIAAGAEHLPEVVVAANDPWCLMYTSGTTGRPKGAVRSHRGMAMLALMTEVELGLHRHDDALMVMPMCHANSLYFFAAFVYCSATVTVYSRRSFDAGECLRAIGDTGITFTSLVPTQYNMLLEVPKADRGVAPFERVE